MIISLYKVWVSTLLMLAVSACWHSSQQQHVSSQDHISRVLDKLQSRDESDLVEARAELAEMGDETIKPLVRLLRVLTPKGRYASTMAIADEQQPETTKENPAALDNGTRSRVINDIYEALGRLHAVEAVPLLVSIMENEEIDNMIQGMSPVMRALAEVGSEAVPALIECLDEATSRTLASPSARPKDSGGEAPQRTLGLVAGRIQLRAILVLRKISDKRAIPALERVETSTDNQFIRNQAREALQTIRTN